MIVFKKIRFKNFLSTGNAFIEIQLDKNQTTLVVGQNGSGKSLMLDAICYALFGKAYRNINKPQLINSINDKNCLVEIEFEIASKKYKVRRGMKPNIFEIFVDDKLINQDSATKDYQKYLEETILKITYSGFTQVVILGSASFIPFMQLPAAERRDIIENFLDIKIFSHMNVVLKQKVSDLKDKTKEIDNKILLTKEKIDIQKKYIQTLQNDRSVQIEDIDKKYKQSVEDIQQFNEKISKLMEEKNNLLSNDLKQRKVIESSIRSVMTEINTLERQKKVLENKEKFFDTNTVCPSCEQPIGEHLKEDVRKCINDEILTLDESLQKNRDLKKLLEEEEELVEKLENNLEALDNTIDSLKQDLELSNRYLKKLDAEKLALDIKLQSIDPEKQKLKELAEEGMGLTKEKSALNEEQHYYDIANVLLKDSGIKTLVVKKYLPIINNLVNKYLGTMDLFVQFTLDEKFNEVIKSRHRDIFSYASFSQGEKQRIDLALLFTWRSIAKMRNSTNTNLLLLDEVFDSSLDASATESVIGMLNTLGKDVNVFVISHKGDNLFDKFTNVMRVSKKKNFTVIS